MELQGRIPRDPRAQVEHCRTDIRDVKQRTPGNPTRHKWQHEKTCCRHAASPGRLVGRIVLLNSTNGKPAAKNLEPTRNAYGTARLRPATGIRLPTSRAKAVAARQNSRRPRVCAAGAPGQSAGDGDAWHGKRKSGRRKPVARNARFLGRKWTVERASGGCATTRCGKAKSPRFVRRSGQSCPRSSDFIAPRMKNIITANRTEPKTIAAASITPK